MAKKKFIDEFYLTNIKKHKHLEGKVKGRHFAVIGPNGAGKTTVFQAIRRLTASLPKAEKPEVWITQGEEEGEMKLVLVNNGDTYQVEEKISKGGRSRIKLWKLTGDQKDEIKPAQERLQQIFGSVLDMTPLMDMPGTEQFEYLKNALGIEVSKYESDRELLVKEHTRVKSRRSAILSLVKPVTAEEIKEYAEEKNVAAVLKKKVDTAPLKADQETYTTGLKQIEEAENRITEIEEEIKKLRKVQENLKDAVTLKTKLKNNLTIVTAKIEKAVEANADVEKEIMTFGEHNRKHLQVVQYQEQQKEVTALVEEQKAAAEKIATLDKTFFDMLADIPFDEVQPGLKLVYDLGGDDKPKKIGLFLDDLPFNKKQLSYGLMIKSLIKLAAFLNEDGLNFVYISDWDLLDSKNKQDLLEFAEAQDNVQLGIEKVDDRTEVAIEFIDIK